MQFQFNARRTHSNNQTAKLFTTNASDFTVIFLLSMHTVPSETIQFRIIFKQDIKRAMF